MITVLTGTNSFEVHEALQGLIQAFHGVAEKVDGTMLELKDLPDLLMGSTLFAQQRLVIIRDLSHNASLWEKLPEWLPRIADEVQLVLVDEKLDKRTAAYKALKLAAAIKEFPAWTDRDRVLAHTWVQKRAGSVGLTLDKKAAHHLVERVGLDQWQLAQSLEKLALVDAVTPQVIDELIEPNPAENVFQLFETALGGDAAEVHRMLQTLELTDDPYKLFALLSSQAFQLAAVASAGSNDNPAKDMAIHPYVVSKLQRHARRLGQRGTLRLLRAFAQADADMKTSRGEPWLLIERTLLSIEK
jgi:DNA polymerase III delta subunit